MVYTRGRAGTVTLGQTWSEFVNVLLVVRVVEDVESARLAAVVSCDPFDVLFDSTNTP